MQNILNKPLVAYVAYGPLGIEHLKKFIKNYEKYESGFEHDLLICFKNFSDYSKIQEWKKIININFIEFYDREIKNDFDIGSYFRIAKKYSDRLIFFLGTYAAPIVRNWLKILINNYEPKSVLGTMGSYASMPSQFFNFYYNQYTKFQQIRWGLYHMIKVKLFPNPHIRTNGFMISAKDFLSLKYDRNKFVKKIETNYFEGGRFGMSNQLLSKGFKLFIVNSDNKKFDLDDWYKSDTYCLNHQEKLLFTDKRTNEYHLADTSEKKKLTKHTWGKYFKIS